MTKICSNEDCPDIELFGVRGEYGDGVTLCPKCGSELIASKPAEELETEPVEDTITDWIEPVIPGEGEFSYLASFRDLPDAHLARGLMLASGFYAELLDEYIIGVNWLYSQANHGVKLVVVSETPDHAQEMLNTDARHLLHHQPEMSLTPTPFDFCPRCDSENVARPKWSQALKALALLLVWPFLLVPIAAHFESTRCTDCGCRWHPQWKT